LALRRTITSVGDHGVQGLGAALGLPFLKRADDRIDLERHEDEDRIRILGDAERHDGRPEKQIDQGASELTEIDRRRSGAFGARQHVAPEHLPALGDLVHPQAGRAAFEDGDGLRGTRRVPQAADDVFDQG
jgi:hypothetical protein